VARLETSRGAYFLRATGEPERTDSAVVLTLNLERADGIERIGFRCSIANALLDSKGAASTDALVERLAPWVERDFERIREEALKSARAERKLLEFSFDAHNRGPF
jgi:hypothetical protein